MFNSKFTITIKSLSSSVYWINMFGLYRVCLASLYLQLVFFLFQIFFFIISLVAFKFTLVLKQDWLKCTLSKIFCGKIFLFHFYCTLSHIMYGDKKECCRYTTAVAVYLISVRLLHLQLCMPFPLELCIMYYCKKEKQASERTSERAATSFPVCLFLLNQHLC